MKIEKSEQGRKSNRARVTIAECREDVVSIQDSSGEFMVLFESATSLPSERVIQGLRQLADEMEKSRHTLLPTTQPQARA